MNWRTHCVESWSTWRYVYYVNDDEIELRDGADGGIPIIDCERGWSSSNGFSPCGHSSDHGQAREPQKHSIRGSHVHKFDMRHVQGHPSTTFQMPRFKAALPHPPAMNQQQLTFALLIHDIILPFTRQDIIAYHTPQSHELFTTLMSFFDGSTDQSDTCSYLPFNLLYEGLFLFSHSFLC